MIVAKPRRTFAETFSEDLTPEMKAFRKGATPVQEQIIQEQIIQEQAVPSDTSKALPLQREAEEPAPKGKNRKLVVELEPDLYDAFATACFTQKLKMAKIVRKWVEEFCQEN